MTNNGRFTGEEEFILNGKPTGENVTSFWRWAYSELDSNIVRSALAEYIVASALGITDNPDEAYRKMWRPYDLMYKGKKIEVKSASSVQTWNVKNKGKYTFSIAPARIPGEDGDYHDDSPLQRNSDFYIFCIYEPKDEKTMALNLDSWRFLVLLTKVIDEMSPTQKTIGIGPLMKLKPVECGYGELKGVIDKLR